MLVVDSATTTGGAAALSTYLWVGAASGEICIYPVEVCESHHVPAWISRYYALEHLRHRNVCMQCSKPL